MKAALFTLTSLLIPILCWGQENEKEITTVTGLIVYAIPEVPTAPTATKTHNAEELTKIIIDILNDTLQDVPTDTTKNQKTKLAELTTIIEAALNDTIPEKETNPTTIQKTKEDELIERVMKILNKDATPNTIIGEVGIENKTIVYDNNLKNKLDDQYSKRSLAILRELYLSLTNLEKQDGAQYKKLEITLMNDSSKTVYNTPIVKIDSVKFDIQEGMLEFIKVYLNDGTTYSNKKSPIAILYLENRGNDRLYNADGDKFLLLKNIVTFDNHKRFGYIPDNHTFTLRNNKDNIAPKQQLDKKNNINSLVNFTAYSDLLGLLGDEPNAILNLEASAKFYLHRYNYANKFIYLFPSFQPHFFYNKVDSKFDSVVVNNNNINPTEIFRRHNYAVGFDFTAFRWDWKPANSLEIKAGYLYTSSKVYVESEKTNAINHIKYVEVNLRSKIIDNFGIDLNLKQMWQGLNNNTFFDASNEIMTAFRGGIYYTSSNATGDDKLFLRFTNYVVWGDRTNDFSQIQIGFIKSLKL